MSPRRNPRRILCASGASLCQRLIFLCAAIELVVVLLATYLWRRQGAMPEEEIEQEASLSRSTSTKTRTQPMRSAFARQYIHLTTLGKPGTSRDLPTLSAAVAYDRGRGKLLATKWSKAKHDIRRRCANSSNARWFATSGRKDYVGYVSEELQELGLCGLSQPSLRHLHKLDFYVGEQFESDNAPEWAMKQGVLAPFFASSASIGSIDGLMAIFGSKDSYANLFWYCKDLARDGHPRRLLCPNAWLPSFNVFGDENKQSLGYKRHTITKDQVPYFENLFRLMRGAKPPTWWIVKPQKGTFLSRGMHLSQLSKVDMNSKNSLLSWIANNVIEPRCKKETRSSADCHRRMVTFQIYVNSPALFHGRKFDMRVWIIVTSVDPLRLFLLRHGYPKVASRPFSRGQQQINDQCVHIKMLLDPECNVTMRKFTSPFPYGYPRSTASPVFFQGLEFPGLSRERPETRRRSPSSYSHLASYMTDKTRPRDWPVKEQFWSRHIWPAIEAALVKVVMLVRSNLTDTKATTSSTRRFSLLSPDVTIDDKGHVYVEEVNTNGLVMGTHLNSGGHGNLFYDNSYVKGMLQIVGADDYPRKAEYADILENAISAFCERAGDAACNIQGAREAMAQAIHEEAHAGRHYYRVFPPVACFAAQGPCRDANRDGGPSFWPNQALFTEEEYAAMRESPLDRVVRDFLTTTDTERIHGVSQVPGHARWQPRELDGAMSI